MKKLLASLVAAFCVYGNAAENKGTNLISSQNASAAVLTIAKAKKSTAAPNVPSSFLFTHRASLKRTDSNDEPIAKKAEIAGQATATNAFPARAGTVRSVQRYQPRYEIVPMTTEALAERRAIIGWEIRRKKR